MRPLPPAVPAGVVFPPSAACASLSNHGPTAASAPMKLLARSNCRRRRPRAVRKPVEPLLVHFVPVQQTIGRPFIERGILDVLAEHAGAFLVAATEEIAAVVVVHRALARRSGHRAGASRQPPARHSSPSIPWASDASVFSRAQSSAQAPVPTGSTESQIKANPPDWRQPLPRKRRTGMVTGYGRAKARLNAARTLFVRQNCGMIQLSHQWPPSGPVHLILQGRNRSEPPC